ncbi:MAG: YicC family protein [Planctomycetota bacterium]|nr:MAG: YicC family protein [Planctomycetota bacterium]
MTGFGDASIHKDGTHYFVEIRALNNKYFKPILRLPDSLQPLEAELESTLRRLLRRGTVTLSVSVSEKSADAALEINHEALQRYVDQLKEARAVRDGAVALDLAALLTLPGVLQPPADEEERLQRARSVLSTLIERACEALIDRRAREGEALAEELRSLLAVIADRLDQIDARAGEVVAEYERRLKTRVELLLQDAELVAEPPDLIREIAVYAEKTDIREEITRLREHLRHFGDLLLEDDDTPVGRTLDFLSQEMLREANTMASKSPNAELARLIVDIKGAIDRIKEQVQNVE